MSGPSVSNNSSRQILPNAANNQIPVWNDSLKKWVAANQAGGDVSLAGNNAFTGQNSFSLSPYVGVDLPENRFTTFTDLTAYVAKTGDETISGVKSFSSIINTNGGLAMRYASTPAGTENYTTLFADSTGRLSWRNGTGFTRTFDAGSITANRSWNLPDSNITFIGTNAPIDGTLRSIICGGTSPLQLSTTRVAVGTDLFFNGITNLFPRIKRNGAAIDFVLASDTGFCNINAANTILKGSTATSAASALLVTDSADLLLLRVRNDGQITIGNSSNFTIEGGSGTTYNRFELVVGALSSVPSAILSATSTTRGFLPPRMTTAQKNAISSPAQGLVVFDTTLGKLSVFNATWETLTSLG